MMKIKIFLREFLRWAYKKTTHIFWNPQAISKDQVEYIVAMIEIYQLAQKVPGHIIELGVGTGRNSIIFGSLIKKYQQEKFKKYFGFDTFESFTDEDIKDTPYLKKEKLSNIVSYELINEYIASNQFDDVVTLIKGDIVKTIPKFVKNKNNDYGFHRLLISMIYLDCNASRPIKFTLNYIKEFLSPGALIFVDENKLGDETISLKNFCVENNISIQSFKYKHHLSSYAIWQK